MNRAGFLFFLIPVVGGGVACGGCGDGPPVAPQDAGPDAGQTDAVPERAEASPCTPPPRPSFVPSSWTTWDDFAPCSGFYEPTNASDLPSGFAWEACGPETLPAVPGCRRLMSFFAEVRGSFADGAIDSNGNPVLIQASGSKGAGGGIIRVGVVDGSVASALAWTIGNGAYLIPTLSLAQSVAPPRWTVEVTQLPSVETIGALSGRMDRPGPALALHIPANSSAFAIGQPGLLRINLGSLELLDAESGGHLSDITTPSSNAGLAQGAPHFFADKLFWVGNSNRTLIARRWDVGDPGPTDFIDYRPDPDHAAGALATDGKVLVWLEAHGPEQVNGGFWTTGDYWMAPLVKDPKLLAPKRIRSELQNAVAGLPLVIGCGYVSTYNGKGVRIVRLADGYSSFLPGDPKTSWSWQDPLAITCTEIFLRTGYKAETGVARIPLASLPFSDPPD